MIKIPPTKQVFKLLNSGRNGHKACDVLPGKHWVFLNIVLAQEFINGLGI
jgi:hypothetical protein